MCFIHRGLVPSLARFRPNYSTLYISVNRRAYFGLFNMDSYTKVAFSLYYFYCVIFSISLCPKAIIQRRKVESSYSISSSLLDLLYLRFPLLPSLALPITSHFYVLGISKHYSVQITSPMNFIWVLPITKKHWRPNAHIFPPWPHGSFIFLIKSRQFGVPPARGEVYLDWPDIEVEVGDHSKAGEPGSHWEPT